jgi:hypothetical protein
MDCATDTGRQIPAQEAYGYIIPPMPRFTPSQLRTARILGILIGVDELRMWFERGRHHSIPTMLLILFVQALAAVFLILGAETFIAWRAAKRTDGD